MEGRLKTFKMRKGSKMLTAFIWMSIPAFFLTKLQQGCIDQWKEQADKNQELFLVVDQWLSVRQDGKRLQEYFVKNNYHTIAIYGMEHLGRHLVKELRNTEVEIAYGIDTNCSNIHSDITVVTLKDDLLKVDAVVITALGAFDAIYETLSVKLDCPIIAIEDILNEI